MDKSFSTELVEYVYVINNYNVGEFTSKSDERLRCTNDCHFSWQAIEVERGYDEENSKSFVVVCEGELGGGLSSLEKTEVSTCCDEMSRFPNIHRCIRMDNLHLELGEQGLL